MSFQYSELMLFKLQNYDGKYIAHANEALL